MNVLHVDRADDSRRRVKAALSATVEGVDGADGARTALREHPVDCIVTELALPDADGIAFVTELADGHIDVPVVVYTGEGSESLAGEAVAAGADAYVPKPDVETLAERVRDLAGTTGSRAAGLVDEQSPLAIVEWDHEFRARTWNPAAEDLFGYDAETAVGEFLWDLIIPESAREEVEEVVEELLTGEGGRHNVNENLRADGTTITCEWHNVPRYDDGELVGVLSFARDVSDEVLRSERLEALQELSRELIRAGSREAVAEQVVAAADDVLGRSLASVRLYDHEEDVLLPAALSDESRSMLDERGLEAPPIGPSDDPHWEAFDTGETVLVEDATAADPVHDEPIPFESGLFEPLGDHGVLGVGSTETDDFDEDETRMARILAATVEAALDRAARQRDLQRYETIVEAAGDGVFALDAGGHYVEANDRFLDMLDRDREWLLGSHPSAFLDDDDLARAKDAVRRLVDGDADVVTYEVTLQRPDGDGIPAEVSQSRLPGDEFRGTVGAARDISKRKEMERALRERKRKIEALHGVASDLDACETAAEVGSVAVEAARKVLDFDECAIRRREGDAFRLLAATTDDTPERRPGEGLYRETSSSGESQIVDDLREVDLPIDDPRGFRSALSVPVGDGAVLQALSTDAGAFDRDDAELAELLASHVADALERLAVEEELRTERDRFAALFDNVPDPVVATEHTGESVAITDVNRAFEETFGYAREAVLGEDLDELIVPPGEESAAVDINQQARAGDIVEREVRRRTADGLRDFRLTVVPVDLDEGNPATFGVYTDVTERKQRRKRVEVLNRVLRHDLRNGMNIVRGEAELLANELDADDAAHARTILDRADDLLRLAERTRAVQRSLDRDTSTASEIDLAAVVTEAIADIRDRFPEADVTVETPDSAVVVGERLLELAVFDAIENAVVHSDRATPEVEVTVEHADGDVVVRIADDGPGIPESERKLLTGDQEITQLHHGSGLGLWLVHWSVTHSGGELSFDDRDPRGSVVTMRLPASATVDRKRTAGD